MHHRKAASLRRRVSVSVLSLILAFGVVGCSNPAGQGKAAQKSKVVLASTTSTEDSGLFDALVPSFEKDNPEYELDYVAVGTGEALKLGETKDADVLLVHSKSDEEKFVANGFGVERRDVMYNDFVIVGPAADPAGVKASADQTAAITAIAAAGKSGKTAFVSRGDDSGTHKTELRLWASSGLITPTPEADEWYESTGQGMGETLKIASEKGAYAIADRATYLAMKDTLDLAIVREGDKGLLNQYGVIVVVDSENQTGGQAFFDWILSEAGQEVIRGFGVNKYGQALFIPNAQ